MIQLVDARLDDPVADRVSRSHARAIKEMQDQVPALKVIPNVSLADTVNTFVAHGLDRRPLWVGVSCPRGALAAGIVRDVTDGSLPGLFSSAVDRTRHIVLRADGFAATVVVDILVL